MSRIVIHNHLPGTKDAGKWDDAQELQVEAQSAKKDRLRSIAQSVGAKLSGEFEDSRGRSTFTFNVLDDNVAAFRSAMRAAGFTVT